MDRQNGKNDKWRKKIGKNFLGWYQICSRIKLHCIQSPGRPPGTIGWQGSQIPLPQADYTRESRRLPGNNHNVRAHCGQGDSRPQLFILRDPTCSATFLFLTEHQLPPPLRVRSLVDYAPFNHCQLISSVQELQGPYLLAMHAMVSEGRYGCFAYAWHGDIALKPPGIPQ